MTAGPEMGQFGCCFLVIFYPLHNFVIKCPEEANIWTNILLACARSLTLFKLDSVIVFNFSHETFILVNIQKLKCCNLFHVHHSRNGEDLDSNLVSNVGEKAGKCKIIVTLLMSALD